MKKLFAALVTSLIVTATGAFSATFDYKIRIDSISGDGQAMNVGFFSTGSIGDLGTGSARTDTAFPSPVPGQLLDNSLFGATFPGVATAGSFFDNPVVHDPAAGTVTVSGSLGGVTGPYSDFLSAGVFEFVFSGAAGAAFASLADYETFLSSATMSGFFSGTFFVSDGRGGEVAFAQRIDFSDATPIPLPAGAVLLLSGLGLLAWRRKT